MVAALGVGAVLALATFASVDAQTPAPNEQRLPPDVLTCWSRAGVRSRFLVAVPEVVTCTVRPVGFRDLSNFATSLTVRTSSGSVRYVGRGRVLDGRDDDAHLTWIVPPSVSLASFRAKYEGQLTGFVSPWVEPDRGHALNLTVSVGPDRMVTVTCTLRSPEKAPWAPPGRPSETLAPLLLHAACRPETPTRTKPLVTREGLRATTTFTPDNDLIMGRFICQTTAADRRRMAVASPRVLQRAVAIPPPAEVRFNYRPQTPKVAISLYGVTTDVYVEMLSPGYVWGRFWVGHEDDKQELFYRDAEQRLVVAESYNEGWRWRMWISFSSQTMEIPWDPAHLRLPLLIVQRYANPNASLWSRDDATHDLCGPWGWFVEEAILTAAADRAVLLSEAFTADRRPKPAVAFWSDYVRSPCFETFSWPCTWSWPPATDAPGEPLPSPSPMSWYDDGAEPLDAVPPDEPGQSRAPAARAAGSSRPWVAAATFVGGTVFGGSVVWTCCAYRHRDRVRSCWTRHRRRGDALLARWRRRLGAPAPDESVPGDDPDATRPSGR